MITILFVITFVLGLGSLLTAGCWVGGRYWEAKEISQKNAQYKELCRVILARADAEHQAMLDGDELVGFYGHYPPAEEFRPPPLFMKSERVEECHCIICDVNLSQVDYPVTSTGPFCYGCHKEQVVGAKKLRGHPLIGAVHHVTTPEFERQRRQRQKCDGRSSAAELRQIIIQRRQQICDVCKKLMLDHSEKKLQACQVERDKPARDRCKDCKRFVKRGMGIDLCAKCTESWRHRQPIPSFGGLSNCLTSAALLHGVVAEDTQQLAATMSVPGPTIAIPTHYDEATQAVIPDTWRDCSARDRTGYHYWQEVIYYE